MDTYSLILDLYFPLVSFYAIILYVSIHVFANVLFPIALHWISWRLIHKLDSGKSTFSAGFGELRICDNLCTFTLYMN